MNLTASLSSLRAASPRRGDIDAKRKSKPE